MATITFDTLAFVKQLKAAGFDEAQAEALSNAHKKSLNDIIEDRLATKKDLKELEFGLKSDIIRLEKEIASSKTEIIKWVAGMLVVQAGVVAALVKLL